MFAEQWSIVIVNTISLIVWVINIVDFCAKTKKSSLIISSIGKILRIIMYICAGLWYPCVSECASLFVFLYNAFFKSYNLAFTFIITIILIIFNVIKIKSINNINFDNMIPILAFLITFSGITFFKSMHFIRIFKGIVALMYFYYNISHNIIFSAAQNLFVVLLMIADILINKFDKKSKITKN